MIGSFNDRVAGSMRYSLHKPSEERERCLIHEKFQIYDGAVFVFTKYLNTQTLWDNIKRESASGFRRFDNQRPNGEQENEEFAF